VQVLYDEVVCPQVRTEEVEAFDNPLESSISPAQREQGTIMRAEKAVVHLLQLARKQMPAACEVVQLDLSLPVCNEGPFWISKASDIRSKTRTIYKRQGVSKYWDKLWDYLWWTDNHLAPLYGIRGFDRWLQEPVGWGWGLPQLLCLEYLEVIHWDSLTFQPWISFMLLRYFSRHGEPAEFSPCHPRVAAY